MQFKHTPVAVACLMLFGTSAQAAVVPQPYMTENGIAISPEVSLGYRHDDNIALATDAADEESSDIIELNASVDLEALRGMNTLKVQYHVDAGEYAETDIDDYIDYGFLGGAELGLAPRHTLILDLDFDYQHEGRGDGVSRGQNLDELLYYRTLNMNALYVFGAQGATSTIEPYLGWGNKEYTNGDVVAADSDWDELRYGGSYYYKVSSDTKVFVELNGTQRRYANGDTGSDNDDHFILLGARWDLTGKTSGYAKIGYEFKDYKSSDTEDFDGMSWDMGINVNPVEYSTLTLSASNSAEEPDTESSYMEEVIYSIGWEHYWAERFSTHLTYSHTDDDYVGGTRNDQVDESSISMSYDFRRWLMMEAGYKMKDKDSTNATAGYEQNEYYLTFTGTM